MISGIVRVRRIGRLRLGDLPPVDRRAQDRRIGIARAIEDGGPVVAPAEAGIVLEADPHARGGARTGRDREGGKRAGENDQVLGRHERRLLRSERTPGR